MLRTLRSCSSRYAFGLAATLLCLIVQIANGAKRASTDSDGHGAKGVGEECDQGSIFCGSRFDISTSIVIMTSVIVAFSICMEQFVMDPMKEAPRENPNLGPIVNTIFSELTLLGFIGLFMFVVEKLDLLSHPSYQIFRDKEMMAELFEEVHMVLFLVMILFLFNSFCLLKMGHRTSLEWKRANLRAMDEADDIVREYAECLRKGEVAPRELEDSMRFLSLRRRFMTEDNSKTISNVSTKEGDEAEERKRQKKRKVMKKNRVPHDFELDQYFSFILGHKAGEIIEVPISTWCILEIILIVVFFIQLPCSNFQFACIFVALGYMLMFGAYALDAHLKTVISELVPPVHFEMARQIAFRADAPDEMTALKSAVNGERRKVMIGGVTLNVDSNLHIPSYLKRDVQEIVQSHGTFRRCVSRRVANRHEHLLVGGAGGHTVLMQGIRLISLCSAIYLAIFLVLSFDVFLAHLRNSILSLVVVLCVAIIPLAVNFYMLSLLVTDFVIVTSVEMMKDTKAIGHVKREMVTKKAMIALRLLNTMRKSMPRGKKVGPRHGEDAPALSLKKSSEVWSDPHEHKEKERELKEMFDIFDSDASGFIDRSEFCHLLETMRIGESSDSRAEIFDALDACNESDGEISFGEFMDWIATHQSTNDEELDEEHIEEMAKQLFALIDIPDPETGETDGVISPMEFFTCIQRLSASSNRSSAFSISLEDVEALFRENDEDGDGNLDLEEFEGLLKKYMLGE